jgi:hypothetical protein
LIAAEGSRIRRKGFAGHRLRLGIFENSEFRRLYWATEDDKFTLERLDMGYQVFQVAEDPVESPLCG